MIIVKIKVNRSVSTEATVVMKCNAELCSLSLGKTS